MAARRLEIAISATRKWQHDAFEIATGLGDTTKLH